MWLWVPLLIQICLVSVSASKQYEETVVSCTLYPGCFLSSWFLQDRYRWFSLFTRIRTYSDHLLFILCMKTPLILVISHQSCATSLRLMYVVIFCAYGVSQLYLSCSLNSCASMIFSFGNNHLTCLVIFFCV